jgi:CheY-like chemotaxis protein
MAGSSETNLETILVVDDAAWVANAVVSILERSHFIILRASSGFDALKLAIDYAGKIDLLLSDVNAGNVWSRSDRLSQEHPTRNAFDVHVRILRWEPQGARRRMVLPSKAACANETGGNDSKRPPCAR